MDLAVQGPFRFQRLGRRVDVLRRQAFRKIKSGNVRRENFVLRIVMMDKPDEKPLRAFLAGHGERFLRVYAAHGFEVYGVRSHATAG
jgi:hypothetical protein